jgi:glycosyltransferase involved in cell wall biosynthesis
MVIPLCHTPAKKSPDHNGREAGLILNTPRHRILVVDLARYFGGAEVRVLQLAKEIGPKDCRVVCLEGSPLAKRLNEAGLAPYELHEDKINPRLAISLRNILNEDNFDIVDTHNVQSRGWLAAILPGLKKRPALVATVHSSVHQEHRRNLKGVFYQYVERSLLPGFDHVVTVSAYLCSELIGWKLNPELVSVVPNGVELKRAARREGLETRLELGLKPDDCIVGSVGRLEPAKGHLYLLEAVARLLSDWPQIHCVIIGEGRSHKKLLQHAKSLGLIDRVHITGFRDDIPRFLEAFDVFALPSLTEGIPIALLEACACAKPVVASRVGGVPDVITDGHSGRLVTPGDASALASAIDALLRDRKLAEDLGNQAEQDVANRYSVANMIYCTTQAYQAAMQRRKVKLA